MCLRKTPLAALGYVSACAITIVALTAIARTARTVSVVFAFGDRAFILVMGIGTAKRRAALSTAIATVNNSLWKRHQWLYEWRRRHDERHRSQLTLARRVARA
jgi:hypothetical protein